MQLTIREIDGDAVRASYRCPCGCTPSVDHARGRQSVEEGCCCGNHFAVGLQGSATLEPRPGFPAELQTFDAPWGGRLEAAWLVGPSVHGSTADDHHKDHEEDRAGTDATIDPVCGMVVSAQAAREKGLTSTYDGSELFFCGKGCKLDFDEDPERYLGAGYVPSM